jgi:O-methyltransferase
MTTAQRELYIDLLIKCVSNTIYKDDPFSPEIVGYYSDEKREKGMDWPSRAHSMAGVARLKNVARLAQQVLDDGVPGNFIETGVWRGGCCILIKGVMKINGASDRNVILCDSFEGLPPPNVIDYPADEGLDLYQYPQLAISLENVKNNFAVYDLLDDGVKFVKGFFSETLPRLDPGKLALMRLDGDLYESTIVALDNLYPRLSQRGFIIIDDFGAIPACAQAVQDYRSKHQIVDPIQQIDGTGVWWQKS